MCGLYVYVYMCGFVSVYHMRKVHLKQKVLRASVKFLIPMLMLIKCY